MFKTITFNGITKPYLYLLRGSERPAWAPIENQIIDVPGRPGGYISESKVQVRRLNLAVGLKVPIGMNLEQLKEEMAAWLITDNEAELVISDEPNRNYYAKIEGTFDPENLVRFGTGVLTFICPDPYKYGPEQTKDITTNPMINVQGTAPTGPILTVTLKAPTAYLAISNGEQMNLVGNPVSVDETPVERYTRRYWSQADSLVGWTAPASVEGGAVSGTMATDGFKFSASNYGTGSGWHGPAMKRSLPEILTDFRVDALVELFNDTSKWGKIIISGLDQANNVVFSMSLGDAYSTPQALGQVRAGNQGAGHNIISHIGQPPVWNNFVGLLRIGRIKNTWFAYISRFDMRTGKYDAGMYKEWADNEKIFTRTLAQIQIQMVSYGTRTPAISKLEDIKVFRINDLTPTQIPLIGVEGDVIEFDHVNDIIRRNGEDITKEKAFIGEYFSLNPGENYIVMDPVDVIQSAEVRWRDKWR